MNRNYYFDSNLFSYSPLLQLGPTHPGMHKHVCVLALSIHGDIYFDSTAFSLKYNLYIFINIYIYIYIYIYIF